MSGTTLLIITRLSFFFLITQCSTQNGPSEAAPSKKPRLDDSISQPKLPKPVPAAKARPTTSRPAGRGAAAKPGTLGSKASAAAARKTTSATGNAKPSTLNAARVNGRPGGSKVTGAKPNAASKSSNGAGTAKEKTKRPVWDLKGRLQVSTFTCVLCEHPVWTVTDVSDRESSFVYPPVHLSPSPSLPPSLPSPFLPYSLPPSLPPRTWKLAWPQRNRTRH